MAEIKAAPAKRRTQGSTRSKVGAGRGVRGITDPVICTAYVAEQQESPSPPFLTAVQHG